MPVRVAGYIAAQFFPPFFFRSKAVELEFGTLSSLRIKNVLSELSSLTNKKSQSALLVKACVKVYLSILDTSL
ncbi:hypothetical protein NU09_2793 [Flavobacterium beibuense]|uniref:Uncharacterized protein n=1 Tax=Flavobacterium beibuense TaxID=657326 RepID=A0A444W8C2_9FLAO|nr:hypothetical protein NU09_2793 [Flavobacterium beibuense]